MNELFNLKFRSKVGQLAVHGSIPVERNEAEGG